MFRVYYGFVCYIFRRAFHRTYRTNISKLRGYILMQGFFFKLSIVYADPPYFKRQGRNDTYIQHYHFLEGLTRDLEVWTASIANDKSHKPFHREARRDYEIVDPDEMFDQIIRASAGKVLVLSYCENGYPSTDAILTKLRLRFINVSMETFDYKYALNKSSTSEALFVAHGDRTCVA